MRVKKAAVLTMSCCWVKLLSRPQKSKLTYLDRIRISLILKKYFEEELIMALPNKPLGELDAVANPEIAEHECDVLIVGGGMAACGTAFEIKKWAPDNMKIILVDKAAMERSGAVAQGLSAINTYIGENPIENYVKMVRNDLMGIVREDLIYDLGRHVDTQPD